MIWHDDEAVKEESALVAVSGEGEDEKFGVFGALEEAATLMRDCGESVGLGIQAHGGM